MTDAQTQLFQHLEKVIHSEATPPTYIRLSYEELHNFDEAGKEIAHYPNPGGKRAFCGVPVIGPNDPEPKESASREPLLSDRELLAMEMSNLTESFMLGEWRTTGIDVSAPLPSNLIRAFYEDLIYSGKLKVMEEVEMRPNDYDCLMTCTGCKKGFPYYLLEEFQEATHCPGCGNPIKA